MATFIPNTICLTATGHRRQGQTTRNQYASLHGPRVARNKPQQTSRAKEEDINAPPQDSSDEREVRVFKAEGYGEASDVSESDSEFEEVRVGKPRSSLRIPASPPQTADKSSTGQFREVKPRQQSMLQRSGRMQQPEYLSDDELSMSFEMSQVKRSRKSIGYGKSTGKPKLGNIHQSPPVEQEQKQGRKRKALDAKEETTSNFIRPATDGLLAELNRYRPTPSRSRSLGLGKPLSKYKCSEAEATHPGKESSKGPRFKAPKLPCPPSKANKAKPVFKRPIEPDDEEGSVRAKRSSPRKTKPLSSSKNVLDTGHVGESATIAATKLGLEDVTFVVPSSISTAPSPTPPSPTISELSSPPTSFVDDAAAAEISITSEKDGSPNILPRHATLSQSSQPPSCPLCKAPVDGLFLEGFAGNRRMTVREQAKFCHDHKRRTAEQEWQSKGYPQIDWPFLHMQVKIHSEAIDEILKGERYSHYRNAYEEYLKREKHRTLRQSLAQGGGLEDFSPGYYGSRGAKIMIDNLMSTFATKLRRRAATDSLISSRGVSSYVRAVLVPELATLLVMDDLSFDEVRAREVLGESKGLGLFLNEEEDEIIVDRDEGVDDFVV